MKFVDTHCHIHDPEFDARNDKPADQQIKEAAANDVTQLICVGTSLKSSKEAVDFAENHDNCYSSLALHPHEAEKKSLDDLKRDIKELEKLAKKEPNRLVAIGETGLDYYYHESDEVKQRQKQLLRLHIDLAQKYDLPMIFHIRDAFNDFFEILDEFDGIRGVVHSFSATTKELDGVLKRKLYVGLNGIMTFTRDEEQLEAAKEVPIEKLLLETDAPFLTPKPFRGKVCMPKHLRVTAEFLSKLRGESLEFIASKTSNNAKQLFNL